MRTWHDGGHDYCRGVCVMLQYLCVRAEEEEEAVASGVVLLALFVGVRCVFCLLAGWLAGWLAGGCYEGLPWFCCCCYSCFPRARDRDKSRVRGQTGITPLHHFGDRCLLACLPAAFALL